MTGRKPSAQQSVSSGRSGRDRIGLHWRDSHRLDHCLVECGHGGPSSRLAARQGTEACLYVMIL